MKHFTRIFRREWNVNERNCYRYDLSHASTYYFCLISFFCHHRPLLRQKKESLMSFLLPKVEYYSSIFIDFQLRPTTTSGDWRKRKLFFYHLSYDFFFEWFEENRSYFLCELWMMVLKIYIISYSMECNRPSGFCFGKTL